MTPDDSWRQIAAHPSLISMQSDYTGSPLAFAGAAILSLYLALGPRVAGAQGKWTGIGAIDGTAMYMDTTTIVRTENLRKVWIKSIDRSPRKFITGKDTLEFDTVIGLNVFDCVSHTRVVKTVTYMLGDEIVFNVPETHDVPAALRPRSFFDAIYSDLCGAVR